MTRLSEFIRISKYRWVEFWNYTIFGIKFYRNYSRFYWNNKESKQHKK